MEIRGMLRSPQARVLGWLALFTVATAAFFGLQGSLTSGWQGVLIPLMVFPIYRIMQTLNRTRIEVLEFTEAVRYRDFSRHFNVLKSPHEVRDLREAFNLLNAEMKNIRQEQESHHQNLHQILELVDVGILSFEEKTGEIVWMNRRAKELLDIPFAKTIETLNRRYPTLLPGLMQLRPWNSDILRLDIKNRETKILAMASVFRREEKQFRLVSIQNVDLALDETETKAWQKLLGVMTHEIMNSVAPISSLAGTLRKRLDSFPDSASFEPTDREELALGLATIERRSEGLLRFTAMYRSLSKTTRLNRQEASIRDLFENLILLLQPTLNQKGIRCEVVLKNPGLKGEFDLHLIEQVLLNLVLNAMDAVKDANPGRIQLVGLEEDGHLLLQVRDNGKGIPKEIRERIFVPFFSTKKEGGGIGLSLCKQILMLHKASLRFESEEGKGSIFEVVF